MSSSSGQDHVRHHQPLEVAHLGEHRRVQESWAARPHRPEHVVGIPQPTESLSRDAGRATASARAQLCRGGAGALPGSAEISGCGRDSSAPTGAVWQLIYGDVIARSVASSQQRRCSPRRPSPGWDGAGWVSSVRCGAAPGSEAVAGVKLLAPHWLCAGDGLPLPSCRRKGRLFTGVEGVGRGKCALSVLADGE